MRVYRLYYIESNNGESGACRSYDIMQTTNKEKIENFIKENNIKVQSDLERGECKVFIYDSFEPNYPEFVNLRLLQLAKEDEARSKLRFKRRLTF